VTFARQRKAITAIVKKAYHLYFGCTIGDQDKSWAPHICCRNCAANLSQWLNGKIHAVPFAVPLVWREPSNHATDCYFCMVLPVSGGITKKNKWTIVYPNIPSALRPVPRGEGISVPEPPKELPSTQTTRKDASRPWVLLSRRRLLNHTSPTVGLLRHSHTFSYRTNWTILFAIWSCPRANQSYLYQDLNNGLFSRKMSEFLRFAVVIRSWCLLQKWRWLCVLPRCRWPDECPRNQTWPAIMATIYRLFVTEVWRRCCCIMETTTHPFQSDKLSTWKKRTKT